MYARLASDLNFEICVRIPAIAVHHYRVFAQSCSRLSRSPVHADCRSLQSRSRVCSHHRTSVLSCRRVSSTLIYLMAQKMMKSADRGDVVSRLPYGSEHRHGRHHRRRGTLLQERGGPSVPAMWQRPDSPLGHEDLSKVSGPDAIHRRKGVLDLRCGRALLYQWYLLPGMVRFWESRRIFVL